MSPLHFVGETLRMALGQIPLGLVRAAFVAIPLLLMLWVLRLPATQTTPPDGRGRWDSDLKLWACIALGLQVLVYCLF